MARSSESVLVRFRLPKVQVKQIVAAQRTAGSKETAADFFKDHLLETLERETARAAVGELREVLLELRDEMNANVAGMRSQTLAIAAAFKQLSEKVVNENSLLRQELRTLIAALMSGDESSGGQPGVARTAESRASVPRKTSALDVLGQVAKKRSGP